MTQNRPDYPESFDLSKSEGLESILTLLNLIPDPAIIYHRAQDQVLAANNAFFLLTNLEENEFVGKDIHTLLPNITDTDPTTGHGQKTRLRHKRQPMILVSVRLFSLTKSSENILMLFHPEGIDLEQPGKPADQTELLHKLHSLVQSRTNEDIQAALTQVLVIAGDLLDTDLVCLYKASGSVPQLVRYLSNDSNLAADLPEILTSEDLAIGQSVTLWTLDDVAHSQLEKAAASAKYQYLVIVPLGHESARFGLFVACGKRYKENENLLPMASLVADYTAGLMEDQITLRNTRNLANKIKQVVKIQNEIISNLEEGILILTPEFNGC